MNKIWKKIFKYFKKQKCSFCKKTKSKLYDIPVYSDIHSIVCNMTFESYLTCGKCLRNLLEKHNYTNYLFEEDDRVIKTVINKVNTDCMC